MPLSEQEQINYLANTVALAYANASLSPKETAAIEKIRVELGAKKGVLNSAIKLVESGRYTIAPVGDFATKVRNIADMLYLCSVDGELIDTNKNIIANACNAAGLTQEQFKLMINDTITRLDSTKMVIPCPKCGAEAGGDFKFCPKCGQPIGNTAAAPVRSDFDVPPDGYAIQFCESTAVAFEAALDLAKLAPTFTSCIRNKKTWYMVKWPEQDFSAACNLAEALNSIRNKKVYRSGSEIQWDELFGFLWCIRERNTAYRPIEYCFSKDDNQINPWGCRQARMEWTEWGRWLSYGQFRQSGSLKQPVVWVFDKDRIRHELMTNIHSCQHCPHIRTVLMEAVLDALPNEIQITANGPWKFSRTYEQVPGSIKIVEVERDSFGDLKHEYYADGVRPNGPQALIALLTKAFAAAEISDITVSDLLK